MSKSNKSNTPRKRLRPGDILEIRATQGTAYVRYLGRHAGYGDAIRVLPRWFKERPSRFTVECFQNGYTTFYPAHASVWHELTEIVATVPLAPNENPFEVLRRRGARSRQGEVLAWIIERDGQEKLTRTLSDEERKLPIAAVWNHEYLIEMIDAQWRPEQEG